MKVVYFSNECQFDELPVLFRELNQRSKSRQHPILARFLQDASIAIREETRQLPTELRRLVPTFETVLTFLDFTELRRGPLSGSVDGLLLCIAELGTLISYVLAPIASLKPYANNRVCTGTSRRTPVLSSSMIPAPAWLVSE